MPCNDDNEIDEANRENDDDHDVENDEQISNNIDDKNDDVGSRILWVWILHVGTLQPGQHTLWPRC